MDDVWYVSDILGEKTGYLKNPTKSKSMPLDGWMYADKVTWNADATLVISPGPLSSLCDSLTVSASGPVAEVQPECLGEFSRTEMWWLGRPVFRNSQGWHLYQSPYQGWTVGDKLGKRELIGYMARHCPAGEEIWSYWDGSNWRPATVKIECNVHTGKS